ncbi:MAG: hypothetical protein ABI630_00555 [Betaproteobacteria bacterium]
MNKPLRTTLFLLPFAVAMSVGAAHAQFKAPTKSQPRDALGSGLATPSAPAAPAGPAAGASAPAGDDKSSAEAVVQKIADCVLQGLPPGWAKAQIDVREVGRTDKQRDFEAIYSYEDSAGKTGAFTPCDQREPAMNVYKLNGALEPAKRNWVRATLVLSNEGKFELQYDYTPNDAAASPATAPAPAAAKKDAKKAPKKN